MSTLLTLQFTLTETHVGGAGAVGAVDLPIVREATTGLPFLPETALKGVAREAGERHFGRDSKAVEDLFGPGATVGNLKAGELVFTQGHLLLYPLRSLQHPFVYATCSLLLSRLDRLARAFGVPLPKRADWAALLTDDPAARADPAFTPSSLLIEDSPFAAVQKNKAVGKLGEVIASWLPQDERDTAVRIQTDLVVLPDAAFTAIVSRAAPVRARIRLDSDTGTTSGADGNLWYEEMLPTDCLFWSIIDGREQAAHGVAQFRDDVLPALRHCQIGGGLTTGHGRMWWWSVAGGSA